MTIAISDHGGVPRGEYRLVRSAAHPRPCRIEDELQRRVIQHMRGPLLVLGGPGTGKTTTVVECVAARVEEGIPADRVLVLTFGRRGAADLRDQIEARLTTPVAPLVRTFHGYAFGLLRRAAVAMGQPPPRLLTGPEQDLMIRQLLEGSDADAMGWPLSLRSALRTRDFASQLRDVILRCSERGIGPVGLAELATLRGREDWHAAARFYREYLQVLSLREMGVGVPVGYDYAELIRAAIRLLRGDRELLDAERRRLRFVYVDEMADTDPAQIELLAMMTVDNATLVGFADSDSSIFSFRGSDPMIVSDFTTRFQGRQPGAVIPTVVFTRSYRSRPSLIEATRRVAARLRGPSHHRRLETRVDSGDDGSTLADLEVRVVSTSTSEAAFIARRLRQAHLIHGIPWSSMAVIVRSTLLQLAAIRRALLRAGVPVVTQSEDFPLRLQSAVTPLLLAIRCALNPDRLDEAAANTLVRSPIGGADPLSERRLRQGLRALAYSRGIPANQMYAGALLVEALGDPRIVGEVERRWAAPATAVSTVLNAIRAAAESGGGVTEVLWAAWQATGLGERWSKLSAAGGPRGESADRDLDAVVALFDSAERFADRLPGAGIDVFLDSIEGEDLPADRLAPFADRGSAVRVLTAHASKGLEWDLVAIAGVQEGLWPDLRPRGCILGSDELVDIVAGRDMEPVGRLSALLDEERRLFYVAATRARRHLIVTAVSCGDGEGQPSRFLSELAGGQLLDSEADTPTSGVDSHRCLDLPTLVAQLRRALLDQDTPRPRKEAAASLLAHLAHHAVPGASPDQWWGLPRLSDSRPLAAEGEMVSITPSTVEGLQRCGLRWLLERHGGAPPATPEQGIGNLIHSAAMIAGRATVDRAMLASYIADRFDAIELSARWLVGRERQRVDAMLDKLMNWLATNPRRLVGIEREFLVRLLDSDIPMEIRGRVDRVELDENGRLIVVDLKTGKSAPTDAEVADHAQLAAYQVAVESGAFGESRLTGGAMLVQLGGANKAARQQIQQPLADASDPTWAHALLHRTAATMAASTFEAVANDTCRICSVQIVCPISPRGRQIIQNNQT